MKNIGVYLVLIFLLVREIYSITLCFPEKYKKYETAITAAYSHFDNSQFLKFHYPQNADSYATELTTQNCDIAMTEPLFYDQNYDLFVDIDENLKTTIETRINDEEDGIIYEQLIRDLKNQNQNNAPIKALPMFMDYGILYYRSDKLDKPPRTWKDLDSIDPTIIQNDNGLKMFYVGQFSKDHEFYYNLIENVINTNEFSSIDNITNVETQRKYDVFESGSRYAINQFKNLFDYDIIDENAWNKDSEMAVNNFNNGSILMMRNWSSYLHNITTEFNKKFRGTFEKTKILYSEDKYNGEAPRAVNKGIYLTVVKPKNNLSKDDPTENNRINQSVDIISTITSKEFMKYLIQNEEFYDLPVYGSLLVPGQATGNNTAYNTAYCERIDCQFFRDIRMNHFVPAYDIFYQDEFLKKIENFYNNKAKNLFMHGRNINNDEITLDSVMSYFSDLFEDKYVKIGSAASIIMIIIIAIEIIITSVVAFYIIKYRNFIEIRRSSPLFLIIMLIGIILAFGGVLTYIGKPNNTICMIRPFIFVLAFGLTFFSLLLKTFRIKVIFDKVNIQVKDSFLIFYLCVLLGIELILVVIWTVFAGMKPKINTVNYDMHYYTCQNSGVVGSFIQMFLIVINGLALLYGCYLAYKVKNVYSEYNESKVIGLSIYGIVICMIILMFIVSINYLDHLTLFIIESLMIILSADIILVFMFTPKIWKLHINNISDMPYEKQMYM